VRVLCDLQFLSRHLHLQNISHPYPPVSDFDVGLGKASTFRRALRGYEKVFNTVSKEKVGSDDIWSSI